MCVVVEGDIAHSELLGAAAVIAAMAGVFANAEKVIEGDGASVAGGLKFGQVGGNSELD